MNGLQLQSQNTEPFDYNGKCIFTFHIMYGYELFSDGQEILSSTMSMNEEAKSLRKAAENIENKNSAAYNKVIDELSIILSFANVIAAEQIGTTKAARN